MHLPKLDEIKKTRTKLGLTQAQLARKAGVSQSLIARIEQGTVDPGYSHVASIFTTFEELEHREARAEDIITKGVIGIQESETMEEAASLMKKHNVSQLPVKKDEKIVGSISEKTVLEQLAKGLNLQEVAEQAVRDYMEEPFPTVTLKTPLSLISNLLQYDAAVLVTQAGEVKGIVTNADLLKQLHP
ncbi:CBS domain-containing protein [Candidatus Altiarchaeota archaeon]